MKLIVDMGGSEHWREAGSALPAWLDEHWMAQHNALLICELSDAEDLTAIRSLVSNPDRLLAYPSYQRLQGELNTTQLDKLRQCFMRSLGGSAFVSLQRSTALPAPEDFQSLRTNGQVIAGNDKLSLALISPMPPQASGIANYCCEVLPHLETHYEITLVVQDPVSLAEGLKARYAAINHAEFLLHGGRFDRVMYHFGNSPFHYDYFTLLKARPGVTVLHDVYLGDCIYSNFAAMGKTQLLQGVYESHGWSALSDCNGPVRKAISLYPTSGSVLTDSYGVIVHNEFARDTLALFFDRRLMTQVVTVPLARQVKNLPSRESARDKLAIPEDAVVYASFGQLNHNKCVEELLNCWQNTSLAHNRSVSLLLVGGCPDSVLKKKLQRLIDRLPEPTQVVLTGFVDNSSYEHYLAAADIAIQLRTNSRGESSAALLDCMAAGLTTIINAHGSMAEVVNEAVIAVDDEFSFSQLSGALEDSYQSLETHRATGMSAREYVATHHAPENTADAYRDYIEDFYASASRLEPDVLYNELFAPLVSRTPADIVWGCTEEFDDLFAIAACDHRTPAGDQLLVDVSALLQNQLNAESIRLALKLLRYLLSRRHLAIRVEAIYFDAESQQFRYAREFVRQLLNIEPLHIADDRVEARAGDRYLGLDQNLSTLVAPQSRRSLLNWRGRGVRIQTIFHCSGRQLDSDTSSPEHIAADPERLQALSETCDFVLCLSAAVADEYQQWLDRQEFANLNAPRIACLHAEAGTDRVEELLSAALLAEGNHTESTAVWDASSHSKS